MNFHSLELRRLLSATLDHGWLSLRGTRGDDAVVVSNLGGELIVSLRGQVARFSLNDVQLVIVYGGKGNDTIDCGHSPVACFARGEGGNDIIFGSSKDDTLIGGNGSNQILGDDGNDLLVGNSGNDSLFGGGGQDALFGVKGSDQLHGNEGDDSLVGGRANDIVFGDAGADKISENNDYWVPDFSRCDWSPHIYAGRSTTSLFVEPTLVSVRLRGDEFQPIADGSDTLSGGDGIDLVTYEKRRMPLHLSLDGKGNDGAVRERDKVQPDIENVTGGLGSDVIIGSDKNNLLEGGLLPPPKYGNPPACFEGWASDQGNDTIDGAGGNDTLNGEGGSNVLHGGAGDDLFLANGNFFTDLIDGGSGDDTAHVDVPGPGGHTTDSHELIEHVLEYPDQGDIEPV